MDNTYLSWWQLTQYELYTQPCKIEKKGSNFSFSIRNMNQNFLAVSVWVKEEGYFFSKNGSMSFTTGKVKQEEL